MNGLRSHIKNSKECFIYYFPILSKKGPRRYSLQLAMCGGSAPKVCLLKTTALYERVRKIILMFERLTKIYLTLERIEVSTQY